MFADSTLVVLEIILACVVSVALYLMRCISKKIIDVPAGVSVV